MTCFTNLINIKGICDDPENKSGIWLNTAGISVKEIEQIITSDYKDVQSFVDDKISLATRIVSDRVYNHLSDKFKTTSILDSSRIGYFKDNKVLIAGASKYKGFQVELCNVDSYVKLFVSDLTIFVNYTGEVAIKVFDLIQGKEIDEIKINAVAGEMATISTYKEYFSTRGKLHLAFVYDATGIGSYTTTTSENYCSSCDNTRTWMNKYIRSTGVTIDLLASKIKSNIKQENDTGGLSINYSLQCNHRAWLCTFANEMALPIFWRTAYEIMAFAIYNSEQVNIRTMDVEKLKDRMERYDFEYQKSKSNLLKNIKLPSDKICFECNIKSKNIAILP
jgi:hypothetical protein